jgi:hypothetical protein
MTAPETLAERIGERRGRGADRIAWIAALGDARHVAQARIDGREVHRDILAVFAGRIVRLGRHPFPAEWASAQAQAGAFQVLARVFVTATRPDLVEVLARSVLELATGCQALIDIDLADQAERVRQRQGGGA